MTFMKDLCIAIVLVVIAAIASLCLPVPAQGAEPALIPKGRLAAIYKVPTKGWVLLEKTACPNFILEKITRFKEKQHLWYFGHEYHSADKTLYRLCWTTLDRFDFTDGTKSEEPVAYVVYQKGDDGVLELRLFHPYQPGEEAMNEPTPGI